MPMEKGALSAAKLIAALVATCLIRYFDIFTLTINHNQVGIVPGIIAALVLLSGIAAVAGLWRGKKWGFIPLYFFIPAATMFFGLSLFPFLPQLVPFELRSYAVLGLNMALLCYSIYLLLKLMDRDSYSHKHLEGDLG